MKLLHIDSSITGGNSVSRKLTADIVTRLRNSNPDIDVTHRDLAAEPLGHLTLGDMPAPGGSTAVLDQFLNADVVVIGAPMYNFGVTVQLKSWFDAVARVGVTFRYTATGPEGLLKNKKVYVTLARGGLYRDTGKDWQVPFLKEFLGFIGLTDVTFVYSEGHGMGPEAVAKAQAQANADIEAAVA